MDLCHNFAMRLDAIRKIKRLTLSEFSKALDIPKSTLQDIVRSGNTSLHTALHIAGQLKVPISALTDDAPEIGDTLDALTAFLRCFEFYAPLSREDKQAFKLHLCAILDILRK